MKLTQIICLSIPLALLTANISFAETVWLDSLNLSVTEQGWGTPHKDQSVDGKVLSIGGKQYARGLGTHAESMLNVKLDGNVGLVWLLLHVLMKYLLRSLATIPSDFVKSNMKRGRSRIRRL